MYSIAVVNPKGGSGKTTTAVQLYAGLSLRDRTVLGVDMDPQHNFTSTLNGDCPEPTGVGTTYDLLCGEPAGSCLVEVPRGSLIGSAWGADDKLATIEPVIASRADRYHRLRFGLEPVLDSFDYCVIDTRGANDSLIINALVAADAVVIPMNAAEYDADGLQRFFRDTVHEAAVARRLAGIAPMCILGILIVRYQHSTRLARGMDRAAAQIAAALGTAVFPTHISPSVKVGESQYARRDLFAYDPDRKCPSTRDYDRWVDEVLRMVEGE